MRFAVALCVGVLFATPVTAQTNSALKKASESRNAAVRAGSAKDWAKYTTDDFAVTNPDGTMLSKEQRMAEIEGRPLTTPAPTDVRWREYDGHTAIETSQVSPRGKAARLTVVWVKQGKNWKVAAAQFTPITAP